MPGPARGSRAASGAAGGMKFRGVTARLPFSPSLPRAPETAEAPGLLCDSSVKRAANLILGHDHRHGNVVRLVRNFVEKLHRIGETDGREGAAG